MTHTLNGLRNASTACRKCMAECRMGWRRLSSKILRCAQIICRDPSLQNPELPHILKVSSIKTRIYRLPKKGVSTMNSVIYIGMDVHTTSFSLCSRLIEDPEKAYFETKVPPVPANILKYIKNVQHYFLETYDLNVRPICCYEAGCLGYYLQRYLSEHGVECKIVAPSSLPLRRKCQSKTDRIDAAKLSLYLMMGGSVTYVHIPTKCDESIAAYIHMRDQMRDELKRDKAHIQGFCHRFGFECIVDGKKMAFNTVAYRKWLIHLDTGTPFTNLTLQEYLMKLQSDEERLARLDKQIAEFAHMPEYEAQTKALMCLPGIKELTAMTILTTVGDFERFASPAALASYFGLVPGEESSGENIHRLGISKKGNKRIRCLLMQSAAAYLRWRPGQRSAVLRKRQEGADPALIRYADKATKRVHDRYCKISIKRGANVGKVAAARELTCFIWGILTGHINAEKIICA